MPRRLASPRLAGLGLEATVALAEVARSVKDWLLAFASATGPVVMAQMMEAELTERIGSRHAKIRLLAVSCLPFRRSADRYLAN